MNVLLGIADVVLQRVGVNMPREKAMVRLKDFETLAG